MMSSSSPSSSSYEEKNNSDVAVELASSPNITGDLDADAIKLAQMGYRQDMQRNFSVWSVLGIGFSLTNSWWAISAALVTGISSGGPVLVIYGIILLALISVCVGISLSELASAFPNAGGQYFWANELAPRRYAKLASYLTGWFAWAGALFTSASVALAVAAAIVGCYQLAHPDFTIEPWHVVVCYELVNGFAFFFNCYGKLLPAIATTALYTSLVSFFVILVTVPSVAPTHQEVRFVFTTFVNTTGWPSGGIAFIVGLINCNYPFACLDCAVHMAEEVARPEKMIPIAIMGTVAIGFVTSWFYSVGMFFSMQDLADLQNSVLTTGVPILNLFYQALAGRSMQLAGAVLLEVLIIATGIGCLIASHTWQSRLCWSFARDGGLPGSGYLKRVHAGLDVPLRAHLASNAVVALVGLLYLGSSTAFYSMVTACIVLLYVSYAIPVACLLVRGRDSVPHGVFWTGPLGLVSNVVLLAWTLFTLVFFSFPTVYPAAAGSMNYVSAVYGVLALVILVDWTARGRRGYRGQEERKEDIRRLEEETTEG